MARKQIINRKGDTVTLPAGHYDLDSGTVQPGSANDHDRTGRVFESMWVAGERIIFVKFDNGELCTALDTDAVKVAA